MTVRTFGILSARCAFIFIFLLGSYRCFNEIGFWECVAIVCPKGIHIIRGDRPRGCASNLQILAYHPRIMLYFKTDTLGTRPSFSGLGVWVSGCGRGGGVLVACREARLRRLLPPDGSASPPPDPNGRELRPAQVAWLAVSGLCKQIKEETT